MIDKDEKFIDTLTAATADGRIRWEPTAVEDEYTASYKGKFSVLVKKKSPDWYGIRVVDPAEREMLEYSGVEGGELPYRDWANIRHLFDLARRNALAVENSLDDFIREMGAD